MSDRGRAADDDDDTDSDSDVGGGRSYFDPRRMDREKTPKAPDKPDTSVLDASECRQT